MPPHRLALPAALSVVCAALGWAACSTTGHRRPEQRVAPEVPARISPALASPPADVAGELTQRNLHLYSWLTFVALNWPADASRCVADARQSILDGRGPLVWETYLESSDVFVTPPAQPDPWCGPAVDQRAKRLARLPARLAAAAARAGTDRVFAARGKGPSHAQDFSGGQQLYQVLFEILTDRNGRFVRYEIRLNEDEYRYLIANGLWTKQGQAAFKGAVQFPQEPFGALEIKAAWKVLGKGDDAGRFYRIQGVVANDVQGSMSPGPNPVTLGLVGMHVIHKTRRQPQWIWSTFEHVDNLTTSFHDPDCPSSPPYTAEPTVPCTTPCCLPNAPTACCKPSFPPPPASPMPATFKELNRDGTPANRPAQVTRVLTVEDASLAELNGAFRKLLSGSVWANYELVGTQWADEDGVQPPFLANTSMETFAQGKLPPSDGAAPYPSPRYDPFLPGVTSSCMKCHSRSSTDFSFLPRNAR